MSRRKIIPAALLCCLLFLSVCRAGDYVWMIGGGPVPWNSQGQIELNVKWALEVIRRQAPDSVVRVFYTDGDEPGPDVVAYVDKTEDNSPMLPIARIFGDVEANTEMYYNHSVAGVEGTTRAGPLKERLAQEFGALTNADSGLVVYNGHGSLDDNDHGRNALKLWDKSLLDVYEFEQLLSRVDARIPMRFIMTQCYSGAFARAVHPQAADGTLALAGNRCGFMAESAEREAEGCSGSLRIGEYRDYTTYFFAALDGKTRLKQPLTGNPDRNDDGRVTLREAHFYTLGNAYSTDLSRSTSEEYLAGWEPWYTRWISGNKTAGNSVFSQLAREVTARNGLDGAFSRGSGRAVDYARKLRDESAEAHRENDRLQDGITEVQEAIRMDMLMRYPELNARATDAYREAITARLPEIRSAIMNHARYRELDALYREAGTSDARLLDLERRFAQVQKVFRLRHLAGTEDYLRRFGSSSARAGYHQLVRCEDSPL
jgi:hypothetical protein